MLKRRLRLCSKAHGLVFGLLVCLSNSARSNAQCLVQWNESFGVPGADAAVYALTHFDDGGGPALYAGGAMLNIGGVSANRIAKWDGVN